MTDQAIPLFIATAAIYYLATMVLSFNIDDMTDQNTGTKRIIMTILLCWIRVPVWIIRQLWRLTR